MDVDVDNKPSETFFKFIMIGDAGVGKTSILLRYTTNEFASEYHVTVGAEFGSKTLTLEGGHKVRLQIWDTAGQESFLSIIKSFYRDAHAIFVTYSVTKKESFEHLKMWMHDISEYSDPTAILALVGNQSDQAALREVAYEEGENFMKENNMHFFFETSALNGVNVDLAFKETATLALAKMLKEKGDVTQSFQARRDTVTLRPTKAPKKIDASKDCAC